LLCSRGTRCEPKSGFKMDIPDERRTNMKHTGLWPAIGLGIFITVGLMTVEQGYAAEKEHAPTCTLATLKGRYLFAASGPILPPAFGVTESTPGADAGFEIFNGDGTGTATVTLRVNGKTALENFVTPFSYTVNADCTGTSTVPAGPSFDIFIAPNGEAIARIATDPGNYVSTIDRRVSPK
jgi:hypothetical protein